MPFVHSCLFKISLRKYVMELMFTPLLKHLGIAD